MGKREIARYEQFLLFPQCFQKACFPGASKGIIVWEWVKIGHRLSYAGENLSENKLHPTWLDLETLHSSQLGRLRTQI